MVVKFLGAQKDGLRPKTALKMYKSLVWPILEYASPVLVYSRSQMDKLEKLQLGTLKRILGLRNNTKNESVRVVSGIEPIDTRFGFLKLKHQFRILQKPENSLVKIVYREIEKQDGRDGFLRECTELRARFQVPLPANFDQCLSEYGKSLKEVMYRKSFQTDLEAVKRSGQANILASLFPPNHSYYNYRPLDLIIRVLDKKDRAVRTAFLQNLVGTSYMANRYRKKCAFCESREGTLEHVLFDCTATATARDVLLQYVGDHIAKHNPHLHKMWERAIGAADRGTICTILFGGNYVVNDRGEHVLFRKTHYRHYHHSDRPCLMMGEWLELAEQKLDQMAGG